MKNEDHLIPNDDDIASPVDTSGSMLGELMGESEYSDEPHSVNLINDDGEVNMPSDDDLHAFDEKGHYTVNNEPDFMGDEEGSEIDPFAGSRDDELENIMDEFFSDAGFDLLSPEEGGEMMDAADEFLASHAGGQRVTSKMDSGSVDADDYQPGPERVAFEHIKENVRNAHVKSVKEKNRAKAIEWLFIPNIGDLPFELCCQALQVRPNLIRLRLMYEMKENWLVFNQPLPFMAVGVPEIMCGEILYEEGDAGLMIAKRIWSWPSIETERIAEFCRVNKINNWQAIMEKFDERGLISNRMNNWYFTGRNPEAMGTRKRNEFNWTRIAV